MRMFVYVHDFVLADQGMRCFDNVLCFNISSKYHMCGICAGTQTSLHACMKVCVCISGSSDRRQSAMNDVCLEVSR